MTAFSIKVWSSMQVNGCETVGGNCNGGIEPSSESVWFER